MWEHECEDAVVGRLGRKMLRLDVELKPFSYRMASVT